MERVKKESNAKYVIASVFMLAFMLNDLMFDFLFSFNGSNYISFIFTIGASIITFIGCYKVIKTDIINKVDKISLFIRGNFNLTQVIFSILDILCGFISFVSGMMFFAGVFKVLKFFYIPTKIIIVANKSKTIVKSVQKFSLIWVTGRLLTKNLKGVEKMRVWIKNNKMTLAYCLTIPFLSGYCGYLAVVKFFNLPLVANIIIAIAVGIMSIVLIILLGGDKIKQATFRLASYELNDDNYNKVTTIINTILLEQKQNDEIHKLAMEQLAKEEQQKQEISKEAELKISEEEKQSLINAEIERIKQVRATTKATKVD